MSYLRDFCFLENKMKFLKCPQNNDFLNLSYGNPDFRGIFMFEKKEKWIKCPQKPPFLNIDHGIRHFQGILFFC